MRLFRKPDVKATHYTLPAGEKLKTEVRIAFLSDLHGEAYGEKQEQLLAPVRRFAPDLVLFGGDTFDERIPWETAAETLRLFADAFPTFYTPGNHEIKTGRAGLVKQTAASTGARLLAGECVLFPVRGEALCLCGVEDPLRQEEVYCSQLQAAQRAIRPSVYTVLITHRPEREHEYCAGAHSFDLILTGHAHGGQWRFPMLKNGFFAPDQGLFPPFAGGLRRAGTGYHLCSRGLARYNTRVPRINNDPELVLLTLRPGNQPFEIL